MIKYIGKRIILILQNKRLAFFYFTGISWHINKNNKINGRTEHWNIIDFKNGKLYIGKGQS